MLHPILKNCVMNPDKSRILNETGLSRFIEGIFFNADDRVVSPVLIHFQTPLMDGIK
jgi:hypothetical protein